MGFTKMLNLIFCYQKSRKLEKCILRKRLFCFSTYLFLLMYFSTEVQTRNVAYSKCAQQVCAHIKQPS